MKKYVAIVHESGCYNDNIKYEFMSEKERRDFLKNMSGVLICIEAYTENA